MPESDARSSDPTQRERNLVDVYVGLKVKACRIARNLDVRTTAMKIGVSSEQLKRWEEGLERFTSDAIHELSKCLNVDILTFFPRSSYPDALVDLAEFINGFDIMTAAPCEVDFEGVKDIVELN